ncbi:MAG: ABC transporter permease subunit [Planctomycetes bacterium]|nr:ABC transporter permease subunit [Planctomycetota bacterium]
MTDVTSGDLATTIPVVRSEQTAVPASRGVNNLGYRAWSDRLVPGWTRWWVITEVGARRAWQSRWLRRMMLFAWLPSMWFGIGFFVWEQAASHPEWKSALKPFLREMPSTTEFTRLRDAVGSTDVEQSRHTVWAWLLLSFFRNPQAVLMVLVIGVISPPLISQDIRSRAFLLYFSRPLTRLEYLLGKLATLWAYLAVISTLPALALYLLGILLSQETSVVQSTWDMPLRILGASVVLMLPTSMLALCCSSLTQESRYAAFGWFAIWILGWFTYVAATSVDTFNASQEAIEMHEQARQSGRPFHRPERKITATKESVWTHLSLYHALGRVQRWMFGFAEFKDVAVSAAILLAISVISLGITYYKISAPMRV